MTRCPPSCNGHVLHKSDPPPRKSTPPPPFGQEDAVYAILLTPEWEERICAMSTPSQRLAEEAQAQRVCPPESTIPEHYKDFTDIFSKEAFSHLPPRKAWDHTIELHPNAKLPRGRTFPLSPAKQKELDEFLRENLANGRICLSKSLIGAPVFFVKKKEGSLCLVQDYQKLNEIMVKNSYPLPLVSDVLTRLCDAEWFMLATFQMMMNNILHPFIDCNEAICYMDDILIHSTSLADHQRITREILQTLCSDKLFLRLEKLSCPTSEDFQEWHSTVGYLTTVPISRSQRPTTHHRHYTHHA